MTKIEHRTRKVQRPAWELPAKSFFVYDDRLYQVLDVDESDPVFVKEMDSSCILVVSEGKVESFNREMEVAEVPYIEFVY